MHIPIRARITAAFAAVMTVLLVGIGVTAYVSMGAALLDEIDSGLRFRAAATASTAAPGAVEPPSPELQEPDEAFGQLLTRSGNILRTQPGFATALLPPEELAAIGEPTFFRRRVPNVKGTARLLAVPVDQPAGAHVLVVGTTMADRTDALRQLGRVFGIGGPIAIALACLAGWAVAGLALRPMERMREQASAITVSGLDRRLSVPPARDEMRRLAITLNDMLERLDRSLARELAFLERASHELRTPLAALRAEVDLALRRRRTPQELSASLRAVSEETDRLVRLAEDLLVLAHADDGRLPLRREELALLATLESAAELFAARALELGISLGVDAHDAMISADPLRLRQALVNLIDNALRHTPRGGGVQLSATISATTVRIVVSDTGSGFGRPAELPVAPPAGSAGSQDRSGQQRHGLGLRIVRAIVASHRGTVLVGSSPGGGGAVEIELPRS